MTMPGQLELQFARVYASLAFDDGCDRRRDGIALAALERIWSATPPSYKAGSQQPWRLWGEILALGPRVQALKLGEEQIIYVLTAEHGEVSRSPCARPKGARFRVFFRTCLSLRLT